MKIIIVLATIVLSLLITGVKVQEGEDRGSDITLIPHSNCAPSFKDRVTYKELPSGDCVGLIVVRQA